MGEGVVFVFFVLILFFSFDLNATMILSKFEHVRVQLTNPRVTVNSSEQLE